MTDKTLGQVAYEARQRDIHPFFARAVPWAEIPQETRDEFERVAAAVVTAYQAGVQVEEDVPPNVIKFRRKDRITHDDIPAGQVMRAAIEAGLEEVVILAFDGNEEEYFASSISDAAKVNWLCDRLKHILVAESDPD